MSRDPNAGGTPVGLLRESSGSSSTERAPPQQEYLQPYTHDSP